MIDSVLVRCGSIIVPAGAGLYTILEKATSILAFYCLLAAAVSTTLLICLYIKKLKSKKDE